MKQLSIFALLRRAHHKATRIFDELNISGLTHPQCEVLSILLQHGALPQMSLISISTSDRSTMSQIVKTLMSHGLVATVRDTQDQRKVMVTITPKGRAELHVAEIARDATDKHLIKALGGGKRQLAAVLLALSQLDVT